MGANSKAKRDARKKRRRAVPIRWEPVDFHALSDSDRLRVLGVDDREPEMIKKWILGRGTPEEFLGWATGQLAGPSGDDEDDDLSDNAMTMLKEHVTHGPGGRLLSEDEIEALQSWTIQQCAEFARQVVAAPAA